MSLHYLGQYTVTRPYAGFRHPDRMAPDQTVREGENDCFIWSGNFLAQVPKFSDIFPNPGIFRRFTLRKNQGRAQGGIELMILGVQILTSTSTPRLPYMKSLQNIKCLFNYSTSCTHNNRMSEFAIRNKQKSIKNKR